MEIREPNNKEEWDKYYRLRWEVLRQPWNQPMGSERDDYEYDAWHFAAFEADEILGVGRLDYIEPTTRQIRFMAVNPNRQSTGIGKRLMIAMELEAWNSGAIEIILHARSNAMWFYEKLGYVCLEPSHLLFGEIQHFLMIKKKG
ncbi:MAG: GNAT family N-acetyltransferase [Flavobacteriales bacterium]